MKNSNNFNFFVPISKIEKGEKIDKNGVKQQTLKVSGIASTSDKDTDGEFLDANGFDCTYLMQNGFINWHHKDTPEYYIGEPTKAEVKNNQLYIEAELYNWNPLAQSVYQMMENLKKDKNASRKLGWSLEGHATKRRSEDKNSPLYKYVEKANVTGMAITPMPKNASTFVDIIKGITSEEPVYDVISTEIIPNGENKTYILDMVTPDGRLRIDQNMCIHIEKNIAPPVLTKAETIEEEKEPEVEKALTTAAGSGAALMPAHVEGQEKKVMTKGQALQVLNAAIEHKLIPTENVDSLKKAIKEKSLKS